MACSGCQQKYMHADKAQAIPYSGNGASKGVIKSSTRLAREEAERSGSTEEGQETAPLISQIPVVGNSGPTNDTE